MQAWKGKLELKELRVNVKETKMTIINQNAGKISKEDKSPVLFVAVILSYASFAGAGFIKGVVVLEVNWKMIVNLNVRHVLITAEGFPRIELNDQSLEIVKKFCYLCDTIEARRVLLIVL